MPGGEKNAPGARGAFFSIGSKGSRDRAYHGVLGVGPLVLADGGVDLVAPALRALLACASGHLLRDGGPAVAVLGLSIDSSKGSRGVSTKEITRRTAVGEGAVVAGGVPEGERARRPRRPSRARL